MKVYITKDKFGINLSISRDKGKTLFTYSELTKRDLRKIVRKINKFLKDENI